MKNHYEPEYVEALFDDMSLTYSNMNYITSFGFSQRWRKQFVRGFDLPKNVMVVDLMSGMGECWKPLLSTFSNISELVAIDFSTEMIRRAKVKIQEFPNQKITILKENVLQNSIPNETVDFVISGFGMKTFNAQQLEKLAQEIERILKVNGQFSLVDVSVPNNRLLRFFYIFYLKKVIPILGKLFLGNAETYRMLGVYSEAFQNAKNVATIFRKYNFEVTYVEYFFGCASGVKGRKIKK